MSTNYENWERLVEAVLDREKLRQLALEASFDSLTSDFSSRFSFESTLHPEYVSDPVFGGLEAPKPFSYNELRKTTKNFRLAFLLREGGSRYYFKGWIDEHTLTASRPGSGLAVTVKSMPKGFQDHKKWLPKVKYLGQLRHPNLVKLMGYCSEAHNRFLVYEFMPEGSLEMNLLGYDFMPRIRDLEMDLSGSSLNQILSWETRVDVAIGVARALSFLHDREPPVIHGHLEASSILLDEDFNAKLEVFSDDPELDDVLAAVLHRADTPHLSLLLTHHQPPEYLVKGEVTAKSDVYCFGVVLLELLSGRRASNQQRIRNERNLVEWAKPHLWDTRKLFRIMDPKLRNQYSNEGACTLAAIAFQCLNTYPKLRPSMTKVLAALEQQFKLSSGN